MIYRGSDPAFENLHRRRTLLSHATLFLGSALHDLESLARHTDVQAHRSGTELITQDAAADAIYFIAYGRVRLTLLGDNGREFAVGTIDRGDCFGETALIENARYPTSAVASEDVLLLVIPRAAFVAYVGAHPATAIRLAIEVTRRLAAGSQQLADLAMSNVETRLARTLKRLAKRDGDPVSNGVLLRRRVTHQELAHSVGTCRETVTRTIAALSRKGMVVTRQGRIIVTASLLAQP
jgi:CRP/FNR family transcriptional regulator, cyclic AMP receptor protein